MEHRYYVLKEWYAPENPYDVRYYTVTLFGEDHPRYVNAYYYKCHDFRGDHVVRLAYPEDGRDDYEAALLSDLYGDTGETDYMFHITRDVFRIED